MLLGAAALATGGAAGLAGSVSRSRPGVAFGTTVRLTVAAPTAAEADSALDAGFAEIAAVHRAASLFDPESEISRLNRTGRLAHPSTTMTDLVSIAGMLFELTSGAFDPTVQPLWQAWAQTRQEPTASEISDILRRVGWHNLAMTDNVITLAGGASLTFNGLAQGLAADRVMMAAKKNGATSAWIDTGEHGLFHHAGALAIVHPRGGQLGRLRMSDGFVAVSGDYASVFTPDFLHHHIFDPRYGVSPAELASVVVVAPSGALADGLATAFMVMGWKHAFSILPQFAAASALAVGKDGQIHASPGMQALFQTT